MSVIPDLRDSFPACQRRSERVITRVSAVPLLADVLEAYRPYAEAFGNRYIEWSRKKRRLAIAVLTQRESVRELNNQLRAVALTLTSIDGGRRRSPVVKKFYPEGWGQALRRQASESLSVAAGVLQSMDGDAHPDIVARRDPLLTAQAALVAAVADRQAASNALAEAKADLVAERIVWRRAFLDFYHSCIAVYPERRSYVNSLFRISTGRRSAEDPEPEAMPGDNPGTVDGSDDGSEEETGSSEDPASDPIG